VTRVLVTGVECWRAARDTAHDAWYAPAWDVAALRSCTAALHLVVGEGRRVQSCADLLALRSSACTHVVHYTVATAQRFTFDLVRYVADAACWNTAAYATSTLENSRYASVVTRYAGEDTTTPVGHDLVSDTGPLPFAHACTWRHERLRTLRHLPRTRTPPHFARVPVAVPVHAVVLTVPRLLRLFTIRGYERDGGDTAWAGITG